MNKQEILNKIKALEGLDNNEKAYLVNLVNTTKKYGLVWEDKPEDVEEELRANLPILKEVKERAIINDTATENHPNHILIEGDNLHALTALTFTHESKIDVIYIDPPYNTGSKEDFIYNDHYVDKEDAFRHSKWLSFMQKRLKIAKSLLKEDGVIFCSIGDDEIAQLTLLFNEIFIENNKLGVITRIAKTAGDMGNHFAPSKDYILVYSKNINRVSNFKDAVDEGLFKKIEIEETRKGDKYRDDVALYQASLTLERSKNARYFISTPDGKMCIPPVGKRWRVVESSSLEMHSKGLIVFKKTKKSPLLDEEGNKSDWNLYTKSYLKDRELKGSSPRDFFEDFINRKGADLIKQYDINFSFSKPYELIQHLIKITNKPTDITVLDFFAGSGTALHSTLSLNNSDGGTRKCIISTNNEANICDEVTYPRAQRILNKYVNKKGKEMPFYPKNNLRYYQCDFIDRKPSISNKKQLTKLATELLCIKENCYNEITSELLKAKWHKLFTNAGNKYVYVIYDDFYIEEAIVALTKFIDNNDKKISIKVYVFSNGQYAYSDEFEDIAANITLAALPDAIYKAYQNVLPKENKVFIPTLEDDINPEIAI